MHVAALRQMLLCWVKGSLDYLRHLLGQLPIVVRLDRPLKQLSRQDFIVCLHILVSSVYHLRWCTQCRSRASEDFLGTLVDRRSIVVNFSQYCATVFVRLLSSTDDEDIIAHAL